MKRTSKGCGKPTSASWESGVEQEILYNSRGEQVKAYRLIEEESGAGAGYEDDQGQQDPQRQYEYSGSGRQWRSRADAADWHEQYGGNADYGGNYEEESGGNRWTNATGKSKGQTERTSPSRPPPVRVTSPPKEEDTHYYQQDPPADRGFAQYVPPSGKGSGKLQASGFDFPEPERPQVRGRTAQVRVSSRAPPQRPMPSRAVSRSRSSWQESADVDMKDKPNEVVEVDDDEENQRSKSVVARPGRPVTS